MEYDEIINSNRVVLVEFYATWCPHCQRMMPVVSNIEAKLGTKATVNQIDVDKYPDKQTYQYSFYDQRCLFPQGCPAYVVTCLATDSAAIIHFKYRSLSETKSEMTPTPINQSFI